MKAMEGLEAPRSNPISAVTATGSPNVAETIEAVFGCKWSLRILGLIREGINRPGAIERRLDGLTPKVQNYYFHRMIDLGILERQVYPEVPPPVEYHLTSYGERFIPLLDSIKALQRELEANSDPAMNTDK
jgi:DNA-binding HxlR family transcriptional regulator